jgi:hypothetical protein
VLAGTMTTVTSTTHLHILLFLCHYSVTILIYRKYTTAEEVSLLGTASKSSLATRGLETSLLKGTLERLYRHATTTTTSKRSSKGKGRGHLFVYLLQYFSA